MIGSIAVLTAAEHSSQVQPSSTLGQSVAIYCMLAVITSTGKLQLLYISKYHVTFVNIFRRTGCSVNIVGREQEL